MIDTGDGGLLLAEMVQIVRTFRAANQRSRSQGLAGTGYGFLQCLRQGDVRLSDLARRNRVSTPVASRTTDALEADGLVERRTDPTDARAQLVSLTAAGRQRLADQESAVVAQFTRALSDWTPADAAQAVGVLRRLNRHLAEAIEPPATEQKARR